MNLEHPIVSYLQIQRSWDLYEKLANLFAVPMGANVTSYTIFHRISELRRNYAGLSPKMTYWSIVHVIVKRDIVTYGQIWAYAA